MLIIVKNKQALDLPDLSLYVLRFIYERDEMSTSDIRLMQESIINWKQHCDTTEDKDLLFILQQMAKMLKDEEEGKFEARKALWKEHGIDWRKAHNVPGAHNIKDLIAAQENYEKWKKENPELAGDNGNGHTSPN